MTNTDITTHTDVASTGNASLNYGSFYINVTASGSRVGEIVQLIQLITTTPERCIPAAVESLNEVRGEVSPDEVSPASEITAQNRISSTGLSCVVTVSVSPTTTLTPEQVAHASATVDMIANAIGADVSEVCLNHTVRTLTSAARANSDQPAGGSMFDSLGAFLGSIFGDDTTPDGTSLFDSIFGEGGLGGNSSLKVRIVNNGAGVFGKGGLFDVNPYKDLSFGESNKEKIEEFLDTDCGQPDCIVHHGFIGEQLRAALADDGKPIFGDGLFTA